MRFNLRQSVACENEESHRNNDNQSAYGSDPEIRFDAGLDTCGGW